MKEFGRFLLSREFMAHMLLAFLVLFAIGCTCWYWLRESTNHGEYIVVPNLTDLTFSEADSLVETLGLSLKIMDTSTYFNPKHPMSGIIDQSPMAGKNVKEGRSVYVYLNRQGFRKVPVPKIIQITKRTAQLQLEAVGFEIEKVTTIERIGRDMVYEIRQDGKKVLPGAELPRTTPLELVVGSGMP